MAAEVGYSSAVFCILGVVCGNVGIGPAASAEKLDVNGVVMVAGTGSLLWHPRVFLCSGSGAGSNSYLTPGSCLGFTHWPVEVSPGA